MSAINRGVQVFCSCMLSSLGAGSLGTHTWGWSFLEVLFLYMYNGRAGWLVITERPRMVLPAVSFCMGGCCI